MKYILGVLLLVSSINIYADSPNTTPMPDWYYDIAMGSVNKLSNLTIGAIDNKYATKIDTFTKDNAVNKDGTSFKVGQAVSAVSMYLLMGSIFKRLIGRRILLR